MRAERAFSSKRDLADTAPEKVVNQSISTETLAMAFRHQTPLTQRYLGNKTLFTKWV